MQTHFDVKYLLLGASLASLIWGIAVINYGYSIYSGSTDIIKTYISDSDVDAKVYNELFNGMITLTDEFEGVFDGNMLKLLSILLIIMGISTLIDSLLGIAGSFLKRQDLIYFLIFLVFISIYFELYEFYLVFYRGVDSFEHKMKNLATTLQKAYTLGKDANEFSKAMNAIMVAGECCGIINGSDFSDSKLNYKFAENTLQFETSPACVEKDQWRKAYQMVKKQSNKLDVESDYFLNMKNMSESEHFSNKRGCFEVLFTEALDSVEELIITIFFFKAILDMLMIAGAILRTLSIYKGKIST